MTSSPDPSAQTKCVVLSGYGGYDKLTVKWESVPEPGPGQLQIAVRACGMNFADLYTRQGLFQPPKMPKPPVIMGREAAGEVKKVGEGVTEFKVGDRVACISNKMGLWSEIACPDACDCFLIPDNMAYDDAASIYVNYATAYCCFFKFGNLNPNDVVFVHSVAGGVGWAATQLAKTVAGVKVLGTASLWKHEDVKANGVDYPISSAESNYVEDVLAHFPEGVDFILDNRSGADFNYERKMLAHMGKIIHLGANNVIQGEQRSYLKLLKTWWDLKSVSVVDLIMLNQSVGGFSLDVLKEKSPQRYSDAIDAVSRLFSEGKIKPRIDSVWTFDEVRNATLHLQSRKNIGKIILRPSTVKDLA